MFAGDLQKVFSFVTGLSICNLTHYLFPWDGSVLSSKASGSAGQGTASYFHREKGRGCAVSSTLLTLCTRYSQPGLHESSSSPGSIPAHPEGSRKPHKTAPLVSQTDHLRNVSSPVRNYKRAEVAFGNKRGRCFSFLPVPVTVRPGVRS